MRMSYPASSRLLAKEWRIVCGQDLRDRLITLIGMQTLMGDLVPPALELRIEIIDIAKGPRGEERVAEVADLALDLALLIPARRRTGPRREIIMSRQFEQARVKPDRGALTFEHRTFQIVVDQGPRGSAEDLKGLDMATQKTLEGLVQGEVREERARVQRTITKPDRARVPWPIRIDPNAPQSICASSAGSTTRRRYRATWTWGRSRRTRRRSWFAEPP